MINGNTILVPPPKSSKLEINSAIIARTATEINDIDGKVKEIRDYCFTSYASLVSVNFPSVSKIGNTAFNKCSSLTTISFPETQLICEWAFAGCVALTSVGFPKVVDIRFNAFNGCTSLSMIGFPAVQRIGSAIGGGIFSNCTSLVDVSFPSAVFIAANTFYNCTRLISIYLTGSSFCNLYNSNAFSSTPIGGYSAVSGQYGSIYVPASLYNTYINATNWSLFSSRIVSVS